ncbi:MAG TPA: hypothetical protein VGM99_06950 [Candidatus Cybelea sp.]
MPPATTTTLGGIIAGPGTTIAADGTLSAIGQVKTVNQNAPNSNGNVSAYLQDAKGIVPGTSASLIQYQGGSGNPLIRVLQCHGIGTYTDWNGQMIEIDTVPATTSSPGTVMAGAGLAVAANGTLSTEGTAIVNLTGAASVALDLTPIVQGAPEILFNLPSAASTTTTLSIANSPAASVTGIPPEATSSSFGVLTGSTNASVIALNAVNLHYQMYDYSMGFTSSNAVTAGAINSVTENYNTTSSSIVVNGTATGGSIRSGGDGINLVFAGVLTEIAGASATFSEVIQFGALLNAADQSALYASQKTWWGTP